MTAQAQTLPDLLAECAAAVPEEPWLFGRERMDWQWRSWSETRQQVARGTAALRAGGCAAGTRVACRRLVAPDAVAVALAVQACGGVAVPGGPADLRAEVGEEEDEGGSVVLPPAPSHLGRLAPEPLDSAATPSSAAFEVRGRRWTHRELLAGAARLDAVLPAHDRRSIVVASCDVAEELRHVLLAWVLRQGAAWALEREPGGFVPTVLWCRPTVAIAGVDELDLLAAALRSERGHRRWSRLRAVVVVDGPSDALERVWAELEVPVVASPP